MGSLAALLIPSQNQINAGRVELFTFLRTSPFPRKKRAITGFLVEGNVRAERAQLPKKNGQSSAFNVQQSLPYVFVKSGQNK